MNEFVKDYVDLCKEACKWYKKHWKGYLLFCIIAGGAEFAWFYRETIKSKLKGVKQED